MIHQNAPKGVFTVGEAVASGLRHGCVRISAIDSFLYREGNARKPDFMNLNGESFPSSLISG